ncbi:MAG: FKBP-type peptidyl-prolyl cis-trans isomerase [Candidatus Thiodiazotropha sp.]|jgi:FKBP-type peptidyl-prolyl cis-trans isomerase FklB
MKHNLFVTILAVFFSTQALASELTTDQQKYSYAMGVKFGQMLKNQVSPDIDIAPFTNAIADILSGKESQLSPEELQQAMKSYFEAQTAKREALASANLEKGKAFRDKNKSRDGVVTLENGIQYEVLTEGKGETPAEDTQVEVQYRGTFINGEEFDSSYKRGKPAQFALNGVIPGFREAITRMKPGAKWKVVVPPELGYGKKGAGTTIGPNETLIFDIEYIGPVQKPAAPKS